MPKITRRNFLVGCSSAVAAMAGARFHSVAFGDPAAEPDQEILIVVFLRGGMDALNFIVPTGGNDRGYYQAARPTLAVPAAQTHALGNHPFGLHPAALALRDLYADGRLALIPAAGMHNDSRSHFDAMSYMELGTPGSNFGSSGWITRHLATTPHQAPGAMLPAMASGTYLPQSLAGSLEAVSVDYPGALTLDNGPWLWRWAQRTALRALYEGGGTAMHAAGVRTLNLADIVELNVSETYTPPPGITYPQDEHGFGDHLQVVAQMIKLQLGLSTVTIDLGGWDTHEFQGEGGAGYFAALVAALADGLAALYADMVASGYANRVTLVAMSEFGRRLEENATAGTDHGHGGMLLVLGGNVNGGLYGAWPGLHPAALFEGIDLETTTDYRRVLSEILIRRLGNPNLGIVFPGYTDYAPLGIVQGVDLTPNYGSSVPTAVQLRGAQAESQAALLLRQGATVAGLGLAATAGLVALRERGRHA